MTDNTKYEVTQASCIEWWGPRQEAKRTAKSGYGYVYVGRRRIPAHRAAYILTGRPLTDEDVVDHLCRNPCCVNPAHLEAVSNVENVMRGDSPPAKNANKTHCERGHPLSGANIYNYRGRRHCRRCRSARVIHDRHVRLGKIPRGTPVDWSKS